MNYDLLDDFCRRHFGATVDRDIAEAYVKNWYKTDKSKRSELADIVFEARKDDLTWQEIAKEIGVSQKEAQKLFSEAVYAELVS